MRSIVDSRSRSRFALASGAAFIAAILALVPVGAVAQERTSYLGPEEGETLTSWTERWLEGPVQYIATAEEQRIYESLGSTTQRLQFIRLFWDRRDPTLRGPDNEFLDEFVRRVEYADEEFTEGNTPGWKTVFGRVALVLGVPERTRRETGFSSDISQRPAMLWGYDRRIPDWPINEDLLFVFQRGRWRLSPPSNLTEPRSASSAARDMERFNMLAEIPNDFERSREALIAESLVQSVRYDNVVNNIEAEVAFPDAEIPFGWAAEFTPGEGGEVEVSFKLTWRMESLVFHVVEEDFETEMVVYAVLYSSDGEPVAETSKHINFTVPVAELADRGDELVEEVLTLTTRPGTYDLRISLDDHLLGYRSVYRDEVVVPQRCADPGISTGTTAGAVRG
jgi:GWxTD domain-containing protein